MDSSVCKRTVWLEVLVHRRKVLPTDPPWYGRPVGIAAALRRAGRRESKDDTGQAGTGIAHRRAPAVL